jgi:hypothetical protein
MALRKNLMLSFLIPSLARDEARTTPIPCVLGGLVHRDTHDHPSSPLTGED